MSYEMIYSLKFCKTSISDFKNGIKLCKTYIPDFGNGTKLCKTYIPDFRNGIIQKLTQSKIYFLWLVNYFKYPYSIANLIKPATFFTSNFANKLLLCVSTVLSLINNSVAISLVVNPLPIRSKISLSLLVNLI